MKRSYFIAAAASAISISAPLLAGAKDLAKRELIETNAKAAGWSEPTWHCGSAVVWLNVESGVFYHKGDRLFGRTQRGAYVCEEEAIVAGNRPGRTAAALS
jgi:hypothetical protein